MRKLMKRGQALDIAMLAGALLLTRFAFRSHYLYDLDSVNFALGIQHFDPSVHQPHPPGYFLYVCLGKLVNGLFHDANAALVAISIVASCGALAAIYLITNDWFGRSAAVFSGLIFLCSPLVWFHGTVALTYIVEAFFSALVGYLCWRVYCGAAALIVPAAVAAGVGAGFRPSFLVFVSCLMLFSFRRATRRQAAKGFAALIATLLAWFVPMIWASGGMDAYVSSLLSLWRLVPSTHTVFNSSPLNSVARLLSIAGIYLLCFGCAAVLPVRALARISPVERAKSWFAVAWIAPGFLFFTLIYLKLVNSGYLLILSPPIFAWLGLWASTWYLASRLRNLWKLSLIVICVGINSLIFLRAPVYCSYGEVRRFEKELEDVLSLLPRIASPADTMIVGFDSHFLGYRHAGYYLPQYLTVQYPEVRLNSGLRVFVMEQRETRLEARLPQAPYKQFVFFPLPPRDREYEDFMVRMRSRFPSGVLRSVRGGHRDFTTGPIADLPLLFPVGVPATPPRVQSLARKEDKVQ